MKKIIQFTAFALLIWMGTSSCSKYYVAASVQPTDLFADYDATQLAYNVPAGTVLLLKGKPKNGFVQARHHYYPDCFWLNYANVSLVPGADPKQYTAVYSQLEAGGTGDAGYDATIQTGPRGGRYYINKNGKKTYVKRGSSGGVKHVGGGRGRH
ncbi:hypothetical protein [Mucilaginibacter sp. L3T2-6]|uniref:hypothetical protein n=1 Tax=Mucilaginibacter sp. L3T2-6 TaxID=3062491 RepID=UPI0026745005|nr:hypothetical protein [Mucilaginibacter sp. L3T2-6]MDO3641267.1 hypothetical protein [Mucilaginibacter sp. L3T2-6]MDV6213973.1 hypothetical protein [Mucilaginibacter sp. L3T2-6]